VTISSPAPTDQVKQFPPSPKKAVKFD
jgi:hypothetical protein